MNFKDVALPKNFVPPSDVYIMGRGKRYANHDGNQRLRDIVNAELPAYLAAPTKTAKSAIIHRVLTTTRENSASGIGFVRHDNQKGTWQLVDNGTARIAVAQNFRDALSMHYKSSKQYKQKRRQDQKTDPGHIGGPKKTQKKPRKTDASKKISRLTEKLEEIQRTLSSSFGPPTSVPSASSIDSTTFKPGSSLVGGLIESSYPRFAERNRGATLFDALFQKFGSSQYIDPFEPTPVKEQTYRDLTFIDEQSHPTLLGL